MIRRPVPAGIARLPVTGPCMTNSRGRIILLRRFSGVRRAIDSLLGGAVRARDDERDPEMAKTEKNKKKASSKPVAREEKKSGAAKATPKPAKVKGKATAAKPPTSKGSKKAVAPKKGAASKPLAAKAKPAKTPPPKGKSAANKPATSAAPSARNKPAKSANTPAANSKTTGSSRKPPAPARKAAAAPAKPAVKPKTATPPAKSRGSADTSSAGPVKLPAKAAIPASPALPATERDNRKTTAAAVKPAPATDARKPQPLKPNSKAPTGVKLLKPVNPVNPLEPPANPDALIHGQKPYIARPGEEYMSEGQIEHFRRILLAWKQELMEEVDRTVHHMQDESANLPDPNDRATQEEEFALELRTRDRERKLIKKIEKTLGQLDSGDYGYCEACGIEIGIRRLEARPTADLCFDCKTLAEIKERQVGSLA